MDDAILTAPPEAPDKWKAAAMSAVDALMLSDAPLQHPPGQTCGLGRRRGKRMKWCNHSGVHDGIKLVASDRSPFKGLGLKSVESQQAGCCPRQVLLLPAAGALTVLLLLLYRPCAVLQVSLRLQRYAAGSRRMVCAWSSTWSMQRGRRSRWAGWDGRRSVVS